MNNLISAATFEPISIQAPNSWVGHLPFAAWVINEVKPKIFVELGTHTGNSYFSFCQSVDESRLATNCYAVDTWQGEVLSANNIKQLWVPEGFANCIVVLSETAEFIYKTTAYYAPEYELSIVWSDPSIVIKLPISGESILSAKDQQAKTLAIAEHFA